MGYEMIAGLQDRPSTMPETQAAAAASSPPCLATTTFLHFLSPRLFFFLPRDRSGQVVNAVLSASNNRSFSEARVELATEGRWSGRSDEILPRSGRRAHSGFAVPPVGAATSDAGGVTKLSREAHLPGCREAVVIEPLEANAERPGFLSGTPKPCRCPRKSWCRVWAPKTRCRGRQKPKPDSARSPETVRLNSHNPQTPRSKLAESRRFSEWSRTGLAGRPRLEMENPAASRTGATRNVGTMKVRFAKRLRKRDRKLYDPQGSGAETLSSTPRMRIPIGAVVPVFAPELRCPVHVWPLALYLPDVPRCLGVPGTLGSQSAAFPFSRLTKPVTAHRLVRFISGASNLPFEI